MEILARRAFLERAVVELVYTVLPALRVNSCIAIDRLMIELLFTNAGFKGYGKNLLNRRLRITQLQ